MVAEAPTVPKISWWTGFQLLMFVVFGVAGWVVLGGPVVGPASLFASFLLLWYWATVEKADFKRLTATILGALVGVALAWQLKVLSTMYGGWGLGVALLVVVLAIYVQIMNWIPIAVNANAMLFLTVVAAPALLTSVDFTKLAMAVVLGAVYFAILVYLATLYVQFRERRR